MILIAGTSGTVAREVMDLLPAAGETALTLSCHPIGGIRTGGYCRPGGPASPPHPMPDALRDIDAVFLNPAATGCAIGELLPLLIGHGIRQVVLWTGPDSQAGRAPAHTAAIERAVRGSGLQWTILRSGDLATEALSWAPQIRATGAVCAAYGDAVTAPIHQRDVAAVAVAALLGADHHGRTYRLTGPQSLRRREQVALIGSVLGRPLRFNELSRHQARRAMLGHNVPETVANGLLGELADRVRHPEPPSTAVADLLGRPALTFTDWVTEHTAAFLRPTAVQPPVPRPPRPARNGSGRSDGFSLGTTTGRR
ncbi:NmrA family transcriptional regulator [Amycolatopsis nigrescens]|uniref:NmrA family transcriptional regulator n=1 Tax=Amycolatopsis nigrescens TaxID=381445 RepID=UPI0012F8DB36|nr:NmrA family transcriptional regulator [Amycolatopsis nigrescens]